MTALLQANGALNEDAIMAEIARRTGEKIWRREFNERHVCKEAAYQQWQLIAPRIDAEWLPAEREEYLRLIRVAGWEPITASGNARHKAMLGEADAIKEAVTSRALAKFYAGN